MLVSSRLFRRSTVALLALTATISWGGRLSAQCPAPDKLDGGPCCAPTSASFPTFPKVKVKSLDICWRDCGIDSVGQCLAVWTPLVMPVVPGVPPDCGLVLKRLDLYDGAGVLKWTGTLRVTYARTWLETNTAGLPLQVWRFLVNGDLRPTPVVAPPPCPLPPCAAAFGGRVRFTGYIDYARDCTAASALEVAWMLTHACDVIDHAPGFPRAGAFHPGRSYTFVGPSAGFVPAPVVGTEGTAFSPFEDVRRVLLPPPGATGPVLCEFEEPIRHSLTPTLLCLCTIGVPFSPQWVLASVMGLGACGTMISTPGGPFLPGYLSMGIGSWTVPGTYPGVEDLRWNAAGYDVTDPCTGALLQQVFFGVTTRGGYPAMQILSGGIGLPLPPIFIDQASSVRLGGGPLMNIPYASDRVLNLNE